MFVERQGIGMVLIVPETSDEREWLQDNTTSEAWQWLGSSLAVDARMAQPVLEAARYEGLLR